VNDSQSRKDAMADAETLLMELEGHFPSTRWYEAERLYRCLDELHSEIYEAVHDPLPPAAVHATAAIAARQAFVVCPGLRRVVAEFGL
jgi:hypothetical protein